MKIAYCIIPKISGPYRFYLNLRKTFKTFDCTLQGVSIGPENDIWDDSIADEGCIKIASGESALQPCARKFVEWIEDNQIDIVIPMSSRIASASIPHLPNSTRVIMRCNNITRHTYDIVTVHPQRVNKIIVNSLRQWNDLIQKRNIQKSKIRLIPHGTDIQPPNKSFQKCSSTGKCINLVFLGRLEEYSKGIFLLPKILNVLEKWKIPFHLSIIGDGPDGRTLIKKMQNFVDTKTVTFLGKLNPEKTSDELSHADIFLMPSKFEGLPNALLENMANGVVPIVSIIKGVTDWIVDNEVNGLICNQGNSQQFAECVRRLYYDNNLLESMSKSATKKVARNYNLEKIGASYNKVFCEVITDPEPATAPEPWCNFKPAMKFQPTWRRFVPEVVKGKARNIYERFGFFHRF